MFPAKRPRLGMAEDGRPTLQEELLALRGEVEPVSSRRGSQPRSEGGGGTVTYRPTYRAILAKNNYLVRKTLGNGSYSKVKLAISLSRNKEYVAIKIVDRNRAPSDFQTKFLPRELDVWPRLRHTNIVRVLDTFDDGRRVYMILDYQENGDVLRYIQKVGALNEPLAQSWTWQVCDACRYLHDQNITHRDLKLENLLLDRNFHIKICDFGFVKGDCLADLSRTYCGSKSYAAPEILLGEPYDPKKADSWAIGVILYIFITGKMPFDESRGNAGVLEEQRRLEFPWRKYKKVTPDERDLVLRLFTYDFRMRPDIHAVLATPWMKQAARTDMSDLRDLAMEGYRHRKEREKEKEREREREKEKQAEKGVYGGSGRGTGGRTHSM
ncbi:testis-specific serine/threonine-protein kinase 3-like [Littorina saxatilis]|uniref:Protein kinase domain-containing protein n=1 Tax=Littorina saxatilis TaxID=31220 RepID=A0AAN9GEU2_9CAEN